MIDYLVDTNIVIYLFNGEQKYIDFFTNNPGSVFGISLVTFMEVLIGAKDEEMFEDLRKKIRVFTLIQFDEKIAVGVCKFLRKRNKKSLKDPQMADTVIGQTALQYNIPLVTNNAKDFKKFEKLKIIVP